MSLTTSLVNQSTHSVMLSPSKKRPQEIVDDASHDSKPTRNQLWRWCLRADAVASCYIRDVIQMKGNGHENGHDSDAFWWIGNVPCRSVMFVGMLVGAKAYEKRTVYTVDDGTGVIQCVHIHPQSAQDKQKVKQQQQRGSSAQQRPPASRASECPAPRYEVGDVLRVSGRVEEWHDTRQIIINDFQLCRANDEPQHWIATAKLHREYYSQPFVIPPLPPPPVPQTPVKPSREAPAPTTPSTVSAVPTPSTAASSSSAASHIENGPTRLRHPSRLRSKEPIASTFKIYLKNYMDILSDPSLQVQYGCRIVESPCKRSTQNDAATPRPKGRHSLSQDSDSTPRPMQWNTTHGNARIPPPARTKGFTLSFLRRVPELADMAHRVVEQERKRRAREERKQEAIQSGASLPPSKRTSAEPPGRKAKRLYMWALRELHREGCIILHEDDAPVWELPVLARASIGIWRVSRAGERSLAMDAADTTGGSLAHSTADESVSHWDPGDLSDPPAHEESYVLLTPAMLTEPVIDAIKGLMVRKKPRAKRAAGQHAPGACRGGGGGGTVVGPTAAELREYLSSVDARWEHVGEYAVMDALDVLKREEKVYRVGNGRWELSI